jgi:transposase
MQDYTSVAIDLAKRSFHIVALNAEGKKALSRKVGRQELTAFMTQTFPPGLPIAMEACGGCHYWGRELTKQGFKVVLLKTLDVKPYARGRQKNDATDALAIARAALDPENRPVPMKSPEQQEMSLLHTLRANTVQSRIRKTNALMALLHECGFVAEASKTTFARVAAARVTQAYEDGFITPALYEALMEEAKAIEAFLAREKDLDKIIEALAQSNKAAQMLQTIPGIGPIISSIMSVQAFERYPTSRDFAASLGLVPSQRTTGGDIHLGPITKRGNRYVRTMLIQGARCILMGCSKGRGKQDALISWAYKLQKRKGFNTACTALARKLACVGYACVVNKTSYQPRTVS